MRIVDTLFSRFSVKTSALAELASVNNVELLFFRLIQEVHTVNNVFNELVNLSQLFQRSTLSPIEAHHLCVSKIRKLEAQLSYPGNNSFWNAKAERF